MSKNAWEKQTEFYIIVIDKYVKFGITHDWEKRLNRYVKDSKDAPLKKVLSKFFPNRWQAELVEQVLKYKMYPKSVRFHKEYTERPLKEVMDFYFKTIRELEPNFEKYKFIHKNEKLRKSFYMRIASGLSIEDFQPSELPREVWEAWMRLKHTDTFKFRRFR